MENAERVKAVCSATPTALDCTGDLVSVFQHIVIYKHTDHHQFIVCFPIGLDFPLITSISMSINVEYWSSVFTTGCPSWHQLHAWDAVLNRTFQNIAFYPKLKFVCTIPTQNSSINLCSKPPFNHLL